MKRYFITGTDTDCGKTYVTTALLNYFKHSIAIKPVATGCYEMNNQLVNEDALEINKACGLGIEKITPWRFRSPVSPHIAAAEEGVYLSISDIVSYCMNLKCSQSDRLFIEGAGGLMVPLNTHETWLDFLKISNIPVIFVVGMKLGCINHALLTETVLKLHQISCIGWIANCKDADMQSLTENIETLVEKLTFPLLTVIHQHGTIEDKLSLLI